VAACAAAWSRRVIVAMCTCVVKVRVGGRREAAAQGFVVAGAGGGCASADAVGVLMAVRIAKRPTGRAVVRPPDPPPVFLAALRACVGRDPGFLRAERLATAGPFAWLDDWSALDDLLERPARDGVAA